MVCFKMIFFVFVENEKFILHLESILSNITMGKQERISSSPTYGRFLCRYLVDGK